MKAVVFGGNGFIGSSLVQELVDRKHSVTVFDQKRPDLLPDSNTWIEGDILDENAVHEVCKGADVIYHFAGWADLETSSQFPVEVVRQNVLGSTIILEAARKAQVKRFVYASSMYVFSKAGSFYRASKQAAELLIEEYQKQYGLAFTILRYGSLYGPGAKKGNAIYDFITQAVSTGSISYWGTGDELRQYIHVSDAARGAVEILDPEFENQYIVLTGSEDVRLKDLLGMINEIFGKKLKVNFQVDTSNKQQFHYSITPYSFSPKLGKKLVFRTYTDMDKDFFSAFSKSTKLITGPKWIPKDSFK